MENGTSAADRAGRHTALKYRLERVSTDPRLAARLRSARNRTSNRVVTFWLVALSAVVVGIGLTLN